MKEILLKVNYVIDDIVSTISTKMIYEQSDDELKNIYFEVCLGKSSFSSQSSDVMEYAVAYLQKALPENIHIACCESCRHGNFCPFGDKENEIFCLKDMIFTDKSDVCKFFSNNSDTLEARSRKLLDFCKDFKPISDIEYYTYNDWESKVKL